ncbi:MAG: hypothetical protein LBK71_09965, partial [Verrucomicrobiales bacterium]|nr:hypothetical protein [Verrucomicrobiales bacterium]
MRIRIFAALLVVAGFMSPSLHGQQVIEALGVARMTGEPSPKDKEDAETDALRQMLAKSLAACLPAGASPRLAADAVKKLAPAQAREFFTSWQILRARERRGYCDVTIQGEVNQAAFAQWLGGFKEDDKIKKLRLLIAIPETHVASPLPDPAGETTMIDVFTQAGFRLNQGEVARVKAHPEIIRRALKGDMVDLLKLAPELHVDLVMIGEALSDRTTAGNLAPGMFYCEGQIEARIIMVDTGDILASGRAKGNATHLALATAHKAAIEAAAKTLGHDLLGKLLVADHGAQARGSVALVVNNVSFKQKVQLKKLLKELPGVNEVAERSSTKTGIEIDVTTDAALEDVVVA